MDEKRLVEHANNYIKQMAKGINPLTGETVPNDDLINNVRISRCLFFVSEILDKYNNTEKKLGRKKDELFNAKASDFANFNYSSEPIYVSVLTKKINETVHNEKMRKLPARAISNWLVSKGFLTLYAKNDGSPSKKATSLGENIGIKTIVKDGANGPYMINVYDINAQKFIIDNIEDICKSLQ